jgi:hypothetical protein
MPTFVCTASVYVDNVDSEQEAQHIINCINEEQNNLFQRIHVRLPDSLLELDSAESHWEPSD